jgi:hypothetical protein
MTKGFCLGNRDDRITRGDMEYFWKKLEANPCCTGCRFEKEFSEAFIPRGRGLCRQNSSS